jgi:hypothetical protein
MIGFFPLQLKPLFWDELEKLLGPILQPIVGPLFDVLRDEAFRSLILSTIIAICLFFLAITYLVYEVPVIFHWLGHGTDLSQGTVPRTREPSRVDAARRAEPRTSARKDMAKTKSLAEEIGDVVVTSRIEKRREEVTLTVNVKNESDFRIEMVVVDITVPQGIDFATGSFRMQRIGTVNPGETHPAVFRLKHTSGSLADVTGQVEFMSSSYEITKVSVPSPEIQ